MNNEYGKSDPVAADTGNAVESNDSVISILNGLIETCKDGQYGFKEAAEGVDRSDLKSAFYEFSQQRAEFAGVLQSLVRTLGGEPEDDGSISGAFHRSWIDIKSAVTGRDEEAILNECERGEDYAKGAYNEAIQKTLPSNIADVINQQAQAVQAAHNRVKMLRDTEGARSDNADNTDARSASPGSGY